MFMFYFYYWVGISAGGIFPENTRSPVVPCYYRDFHVNIDRRVCVRFYILYTVYTTNAKVLFQYKIGVK